MACFTRRQLTGIPPSFNFRNEVANKVKTRDELQCRRYWSYNGQRCLVAKTGPSWNLDMEIDLVKALKAVVFTDEKNIDWNGIAEKVKVDGSSVSPRFCKAKWEEVLSKIVPQAKRGSWKGMWVFGLMVDSLEYLLSHLVQLEVQRGPVGIPVVSTPGGVAPCVLFDEPDVVAAVAPVSQFGCRPIVSSLSVEFIIDSDEE
jgi:hypothetical protein